MWVLTDVRATTCTYYFWWDYGYHHSHRTRVTVYNGGSRGPLIVTPELEVGFSVVRSGDTTLYKGEEREIWGDYVQDIAYGTHVQGRAIHWTYYGSATTFAPYFP